MSEPVSISDEERKVLVQMIRMEDYGNGGYRMTPDLAYSLASKKLVSRNGHLASPKARKLLGMPKPPPSAEELAALRRWVNDGKASGWALSGLERRGLLDPFAQLTDAGRAVLAASGGGE